jgi:hypothetical protein
MSEDDNNDGERRIVQKESSSPCFVGLDRAGESTEVKFGVVQ